MKKKGVNINIHLTNRWLYTIIAIAVIALIAVGVTAYTGPVGHTSDQIDVTWSQILSRPSGLDDGDQVGITSESDPTVPATVKSGIASDVQCNDCVDGGDLAYSLFYRNSYTGDANSYTIQCDNSGDTVVGGGCDCNYARTNNELRTSEPWSTYGWTCACGGLTGNIQAFVICFDKQ